MTFMVTMANFKSYSIQAEVHVVCIYINNDISTTALFKEMIS